MNDKTCFVIMPITMPGDSLSKYYGRTDHFAKVYKEMFVPAITKAGFKPIYPKTKGSNVIQVNIIENLISSDLVLCDISILNPNVFFELGIRTALNKPVCIVKDNLTIDIPFDTSDINYLDYDAEMSVWQVRKDIVSLTKHIIHSVQESNGINIAWRTFGLEKMIKPSLIETDKYTEEDLLNIKINNLTNKMDRLLELIKDIVPSGLTGPTGITGTSFTSGSSGRILGSIELPNYIPPESFYKLKKSTLSLSQNSYAEIERMIDDEFRKFAYPEPNIKLFKIDNTILINTAAEYYNSDLKERIINLLIPYGISLEWEVGTAVRRKPTPRNIRKPENNK